MARGIGCYYHPESSAIAACAECGHGFCRECDAHYSALRKGRGKALCLECLLRSGEVKCEDHPNTEAYAICLECGCGICKDCFNTYGNSTTPMCFACTEKMMADNVAAVEKFKKKVKRGQIVMKVGFFLGVFITAVALIAGIVALANGDAYIEEVFVLVLFTGIFSIGIGASLWTLLKIWGKAILWGGSIGSIFGFIGMIIGGVAGYFVAIPLMFVSPIVAIYQHFKKKKQVAQADEIIESDSRVLQEIRDYFAYTQEMEKHPAMDLTSLADQGGTLFGNTYASAVMSKGESAAQEALRQGAVQIAANGEIIRGFDPPAKKPKKKGQAA